MEHWWNGAESTEVLTVGTLSTTNHTRTGLGLNLDLCCERLVTNPLSNGTAL